MNPHKWLFTPLDASLLLTRRMDVLSEAFSLHPEYLRTLDRATPVRDYTDYTPQLGRRFRALKLWIQLRWFGLDGLRARIREHLELAEWFAAQVDADPDWERLAPVPFATVCFRWRPAGWTGSDEALDDANAAIMDAVNRTGEVFLSHTRLGGPIHDPCLDREPADRAAARRAGLGAPPRGRRGPGRGMKPEPRDVRFFATPEELRDWFDANADTADELWLGGYRKATGRPSVAWSDAVDEALCVGWIDSVRYGLDRTPTRSGSPRGARAATGARSTWPRSRR